MTRLNDRKYNELRQIKVTTDYIKYPEGSVLIEFGDTKVICNATIDENVPPFLRNKQQGWVTAEYSMLPRATHSRTKRDAVSGKVNARASEISRLIGRSLRACVDLKSLGERQILIDCDVVQADGGTRVASITGGFIAMEIAIQKLISSQKIKTNPIKRKLAAISVGVVNGECLLDLDYNEDSNCDSDLNIIMFDDMSIVEIQGTAEKNSIPRDTLNNLIDLAEIGVQSLLQL